MTDPTMDRYRWLKLGIASGWCSPPFCDMHDQAPMTADESERFDAGEDPCTFSVRLWEPEP